MADVRVSAFPYANVRPLHMRGSVSVFAAEGTDGRPVIIKTLNRERASRDEIGSRRFRREISLACSLHHPALARCVGHGEDWIAFERLEASLAEPKLADAYSNPKSVRLLLHDVAETLAYIHARGVVHGDLKPAHIMFRAGQVVLIDFGIAALVCEDPLAGAELAGSPAWMAPEQLAGEAPGPLSDIWSLCAIGTWLMKGAPEIGGTANEMLAARTRSDMHFDLSPIRRSDPELADLLATGLGRMDRRPDAAAVVRHLAVTQ